MVHEEKRFHYRATNVLHFLPSLLALRTLDGCHDDVGDHTYGVRRDGEIGVVAQGKEVVSI